MKFNKKHITFIFLIILVFSQVYSNEKNKRTLIVGIFDSPPKIFLNTEGKPAGILIDIIEEIGTRENLQFQYQYDSWENLYKKLQKGEIDILPGMTYSPERNSLFALNKMELLNSWVEIYARNGLKITSISDLKNKRIGVIKSSLQETQIPIILSQNSIKEFKIIPFENYFEFIDSLKKGKIDVIVVDRFFSFSSKFDESIQQTGIIVSSSSLHLAFNKNEKKELIDLFDKNISNLKNDSNSEYYNSLFRWLDRNVEAQTPEHIKWLILAIIISLIIAISFVFLLRKSVKAQTKELVKAKNRAEEADRLKSAFLANMSHEIRTPMNGIIGFANLLQDQNLEGEKQKKYLKIIQLSGERMLTIINDIINISKIEVGLMELNLQTTAINNQIDFIYNFFKPLAENIGIKLKIKNTYSTTEPQIYTDSEKLIAVLTNLVGNAIKHTEKGSIEIGCHKKADFIEFYVKDTGSGIPEDRQSAIFERFIQADLKNKKAIQGAGLGLSISKAYIEMLGGKIWLESKINKGSTFYFTIPYQAAPINNDVIAPIIPNSKNTLKNKLKIIIAEDDKISALLLTKLLTEYSKEIITVKNGKEAVEVALNNPDIDLIMMDIQMPEMDGHEATIKIREFNQQVIIIAQTAYALKGDKEKIIESGCNNSITKPIKATELKTVIFNYFD